MATKKKAKAKPPKTVAEIGDPVFYYPTPEEQKQNQGAKVLPAVVVSVYPETGNTRLTVFTDGERNGWMKNIPLRTDLSQTGVFDFKNELPEAV